MSRRASPAQDQPEIRRIRAVYSARTHGDRYSSLRADQIALAAARGRGWAAQLARRARPLGRVLEVGTGNGSVLRWAREVGADTVTGVDVLVDRMHAGLAINPSVRYVVADGQELPFSASSFDHVICSTLFSSVLDDHVAGRIASEIGRVLTPDGAVLWFDFFRDNPRNPHVRGVGHRRLARLFPGWAINLERAVLAPPLARCLLDHPRVAALVEMLPPLRTHLVGVLEPASTTATAGPH